MKPEVIKYCIKAMDQNNIGFKYLKKFPKIIDVK